MPLGTLKSQVVQTPTIVHNACDAGILAEGDAHVIRNAGAA